MVHMVRYICNLAYIASTNQLLSPHLKRTTKKRCEQCLIQIKKLRKSANDVGFHAININGYVIGKKVASGY